MFGTFSSPLLVSILCCRAVRIRAGKRVYVQARTIHSNGWPLCACESVKIAAARKGQPVIRRNDGLHSRVSAMKMIEIRPKMWLTKCPVRTAYFHANVFPARSNLGRMNKIMSSLPMFLRACKYFRHFVFIYITVIRKTKKNRAC